MQQTPHQRETEKVIVVTDSSSDLGRLTVNALAQSGHTVYASMRNARGQNAAHLGSVDDYAEANAVDLRHLELNPQSQRSVDSAVAKVMRTHQRIDVVVHNTRQTAFGPAEAFTPKQLAALYDANVLSAQRVNRAVLPHMRQAGQGLLIWVSSGSAAGGSLPYLSPYLAAMAAFDALAVQYARELTRWGIETSIIVAGIFGKAPDFPTQPAPCGDAIRAASYEAGPYAGLGAQVREALAEIVPKDANAGAVAGAIAGVVDTPFGERPFRVHIDPSHNGADIVFGVMDRVREEMLHRVGLSDLLKPRHPV